MEAGPSQEGPGESRAPPPPPRKARDWAGGGADRGPLSSETPACSRTPGVAGAGRRELTSAFKAPLPGHRGGGAREPAPRRHPRPRALRARGAERGAERSTGFTEFPNPGRQDRGGRRCRRPRRHWAVGGE